LWLDEWLATSPSRAQVRDDLATLERQVSDLQTEASTPTNELVDPSQACGKNNPDAA